MSPRNSSQLTIPERIPDLAVYMPQEADKEALKVPLQVLRVRQTRVDCVLSPEGPAPATVLQDAPQLGIAEVEGAKLWLCGP